MDAVQRIIKQRFMDAMKTTESFAGKTVLVTGASTGLGLEAAKKLAALNADQLIVTTRSDAKGAATKKAIESFLQEQASKDGIKAPSSTTEVIPMILDMSSAAGVKTFVASLKARFSRIDAAILNAGTVRSKYEVSPDGWEETLQVNTINTILLGVLIMPLLLAASSKAPGSKKPHLAMVSSGVSWFVKPDGPIREQMTKSKPLRAISEPENFPPGFMGAQTVYGRSKLMLEFGMRHLAALPFLQDANGEPKVIVGTVCPGLCKSELARNQEFTFIQKVIVWLLIFLLARSGEQGARYYVSSLTRDSSSHGQMWKDDKIYPVSSMITSDEGKKFGDNVWNEMVEILAEADPSTKKIMGLS